jgi:hypothetical protein
MRPLRVAGHYWLKGTGWSHSWAPIASEVRFEFVKDHRKTSLDIETGLDGALCVRCARDLALSLGGGEIGLSADGHG